MTPFVLDASVALAWCFEDESTPESWVLLDNLEQVCAFVPAIWLLEVSNILLCSERRGRITYKKANDFFVELKALPINIEHIEHGHILDNVLMLARMEQLTTYDATYLELAKRMDLPIATKDKALRASALRQGVALCSV